MTGQAGASERFNSANMGAGTNISGRQLQALASIQRNLQDYARTDPRVAQTDKERGRISAGGQNFRYNSVTIDGVTMVVDSGLARVARYDPNRGINTLLIEKISRASADQRAGRAGHCVRCRPRRDCCAARGRNRHRDRAAAPRRERRTGPYM